MITLTLQVDDVTDIAYQKLSPEDKQRIADEIAETLKKTVASERADRLKKLLDEIAHDAGGKELSADVLIELLRDED